VVFEAWGFLSGTARFVAQIIQEQIPPVGRNDNFGGVVRFGVGAVFLTG